MKFEYDRELTKQLKLIKMESLLQLTLGAAAIVVLISRAKSKSKTSTSQSNKDQKKGTNRDQEDELIFTSLIVRHGARGPTRKSLYLAVGETPEQKQARNPDQHADKDHPATATQAAQLWKINELDALTTVGAAQLVSNGQQFARYLQSHPNLLQSNTLIKLRRSERPRVIASANSFIEGYTIIQQQQQQQQQTSKNVNTIIPPTLPSLHYQPYPSLQANINVFRAWTGKEYNTAMTEMKTSEHYQKKGEEAATSRVLDATVCICAPWANQMNRAGQLNLTTYLHEVLGCEEYFPDPSKRGFGSLTDFFRNKKELKKDLIQLAHWSFDQRFINRDTVGKEWGMKIGGDLLNEIEQDYQQSKGDGGSKVSIYVGHDYTILSLMAALGVKKHPKEIMGFGGWARMEYRRNRKTGVVRQCLMLQTVPFPDLKDSSRASEKIPEKVYERITK